MSDETLQYPLGKYQPLDAPSAAQLEAFIDEIAEFPALLRKTLRGLSEEQLETPYRQGGWTVRQLVHHIGDSHLNSLIRFKWALTEDNPTIKAYDQDLWAETPDVGETPVAINLDFLEALHRKWVALLRSLAPADWQRTFVHPVTGRQFTLHWLVGLYAWHGKHHTAHIQRLKEREGWG